MDVIAFAVTRLKLSFVDLYRITWAEFELRSFGFWKAYKEELITEAKINWRIYCVFNAKPKPFDVFVKKEYGITLPKGKADLEKIQVMEDAVKRYLEDLKKRND